MPESEQQEYVHDALNPEIDCRFIEEIETPGDDEIRCGLKYLDYYGINDWGIVVLVNHGYQVSSSGGGRVEMLYRPAELETNKISVEWFTVHELTEWRAKQFNIPEDIRELLNKGLALLRDYDLEPNTIEIDRDYVNERYDLDNRKACLRRSLEDRPSPTGDEFTEEETIQEMKELLQIEQMYEVEKGRKAVYARPLEYFLGGLEVLLELANDGEIPEEGSQE